MIKTKPVRHNENDLASALGVAPKDLAALGEAICDAANEGSTLTEVNDNAIRAYHRFVHGKENYVPTDDEIRIVTIIALIHANNT